MKPLFRVLYLFYRGISWVLMWARRRLTNAGIAVVLATVVTFMMSVDTDHNRNYQAFAILFSLAVVGIIFSQGFRGRFEIERAVSRFATVGVPFTYNVQVKNLSRRIQAGLTLLENVHEPRPQFREWYAAQLDEQRRSRSFRISQMRRTSPFRRVRTREVPLPGAMEPQQRQQARLELTPLRRGLLRFDGMTIARTDPLGLFRGLIKVPLPQNILVLPKRYRLPPLPLPGREKYQQGGVAQASHVGQSEEFVALRDYRRGDPLRHIHWRSWARVGQPVVREFEDEFFVRHGLVLDTFTEVEHSDAFEEAVSVAASFASNVVTQESLLDLLFVGPESYCFTSGRGLAHSDQMLEILASVQPCRNRPFKALEALVLDHANALSGCICVFLSWDAARQEFVRKLRLLKIPVLVLVVCESSSFVKDPGPLRDTPEYFKCLEVGRIEQSLDELGNAGPLANARRVA